MKSLTLLTAMFLSAALVGPVSAKERLAFKGNLAAVESYQVLDDPPILFVNSSGTANSTALGQFKTVLAAQVDLTTGFALGTMRFVAPNGDTIFAFFTGQGSDTSDPAVSSIRENAVIAGGTGRFAGAFGTFQVQRTLNLNTGVTSGSFHGIIFIKGKHNH